MVSPNKANVDLRERTPLPRNILHSCGVKDHGTTGQRADQKVHRIPTGRRGQLCHSTDQKVSSDNLIYSDDARDTAKSGMGRIGNRHLSYLIESVSVNVGGSCQDVKASSLPMPDKSVGGVIVLGAQENCVHGEGRQKINNPQVDSNGSSMNFGQSRETKRRMTSPRVILEAES